MRPTGRFILDSIDGISLIKRDGQEIDIKDFPAKGSEAEGDKMCFDDYLTAAWTRTRRDAEKGLDNGDLKFFHNLCRRGVQDNWSKLQPKSFLENYHRCIAAIAKRVSVLEKFLPSQVALFRNHDAARIVSEQESIWDEWKREKRFLNSKMVNAVIETSKLVNEDWEQFRSDYLQLPENPESEFLSDWMRVHKKLDELRMVGTATAWYLIRNLYGAPVFKPDLHICAIANYFFPLAKEPLKAMSDAVHTLWETVCVDERFLPVHLGEVDFVLWWYRQATGLPEIHKPEYSSC